MWISSQPPKSLFEVWVDGAPPNNSTHHWQGTIPNIKFSSLPLFTIMSKVPHPPVDHTEVANSKHQDRLPSKPHFHHRWGLAIHTCRRLMPNHWVQVSIWDRTTGIGWTLRFLRLNRWPEPVAETTTSRLLIPPVALTPTLSMWGTRGLITHSTITLKIIVSMTFCNIQISSWSSSRWRWASQQ